MSSEELATRILGPAGSALFADDVREHAEDLREAVQGRRILVVGGAGSIGSATVRELLARRPACVHVVDPDENGLAELVRDVRSRGIVHVGTELRTLPLDMGSGAMRRLLAEVEPYDCAMSFAALKHVRSEKDVCSLLALLDTNVSRTARLLGWLHDAGMPERFFAVSTDKAARPAGLMGASKRIMEHVLFSGEVLPTEAAAVTSTRFANVAFSNGSLLASFLRRIEKGQPLAAPKDTRRYFVTEDQAAWICLLSALRIPGGRLAIPKPGAAVAELELADVAARVLEAHGFRPSVYDDEDEARASMASERAHGRYPLLLTPRDTAGEKPFEIFLAEGEETEDVGLRDLVGVPYTPAATGAVTGFLAALDEVLTTPRRPLSKDELVEMVGTVVPEMRHVETGRSLDDRM